VEIREETEEKTEADKEKEKEEDPEISPYRGRARVSSTMKSEELIKVEVEARILHDCILK
jgi:hypothetical protein